MLLTREWYMHPNGQVPAYEWAFDDVNPPVLAWAAWRVYQIDAQQRGTPDRDFLERVFHKLMLNFTWWVNRKDQPAATCSRAASWASTTSASSTAAGRCPTGGHLEQADGTAWMGMFSLQLMAIALELARDNSVYEDVATKYFEHFLYIAGAMNDIGGEGIPLWDEEDGFFYDVLRLPDGGMIQPPRPLARRADPAAGGRDHRAGAAASDCPASRGASTGSWPTGPTWPASSRAGRSRACGRAPPAGAGARRPDEAAASRGCSTPTSSCSPTASAR